MSRVAEHEGGNGTLQHAFPQASRHLTHPTYRPDIDGLRAVAVLSVIGFHAFPNHVKGGFVGVDVFFVISGFLISTIIYSSLERNGFTFIEFYSRRIRRIFPALIVVLIACFGFGWFVLMAEEYKQLGKQIAAGAGFVANFALWNENGYFDSAADTKPLLHLWSLGIEEQYYIVWPLLLWLGWKRRIGLLSLICAIAAISFALNIYEFRSDTVAAFYSPQTRFWELLLGSVLAYFTLYGPTRFGGTNARIAATWAALARAHASKPRGTDLRDAQSILGALLIATALILITKEHAFPGYWALLPTLGTVFVIAAGSQAWLNRAILSHRILVWFGLISFPLYLWHWPLLSFARILESGPPSRLTRIAAVLVSIALAWLTTALIEKPLRFGQRGTVKTVGLVMFMIAVGYLGYAIYEEDGLALRFRDRDEYLSFFENSRPQQQYFKRIDLSVAWRAECAFFDNERYRDARLEGTVRDSPPRTSLDKTCYERDSKFDKAALVWGDSHAQQLAPGLRRNMPSNWQLLQIATSACPPDINSDVPSSSQCDHSNYFAIKTIQTARPDVVVLAQNLSYNPQRLNDIASRLLVMGVSRVIFVGPTPHWTTDLPKIIARHLWATPRRTHLGLDQSVLRQNASLRESLELDGTRKYADVISVFCNSDGCMTYIGDDKKYGVIAWDSGHLTPIASDYLAKHLLVDMIIGEH